MARKKKKEEEEGLKENETVQDALERAMGGDLQALSSADALCHVAFSVSSRSMVVDKVLAGGRPMPCSMIPFGRQMEVSGKNGSGKTTLCAQVAAETQKRGGLVAVVDTEERIDEPYWRALGVDTDKVMKIAANTIEEVFNNIEKFIKAFQKLNTEKPLLIIWDSLGGTSSGDIIEGDGDFMTNAKKSMGREAKLIGIGLKGLNPLLAESNICLLYTNHVYNKMGVSFGDPLEEPGGEKAKFAATVRLRLTKIGELSYDDALGNKVVYGQKVLIKANKNSMAPMRMTKEAYIVGGVGFNNDYTVFEMGKKAGIIKNSGAWSTATIGGEEIKFQGWNGFQDKVVQHASYPELYAEVLEAL